MSIYMQDLDGLKKLSGGSTNIIDVTELPTENINSKALYRITEDVYKVSTIDLDPAMQAQATRLKVITVDTLPETGKDFNSDLVVYYNRTEDNVYLYTEQTWLTSTAAGYPYLGCVSSYEEMTSTEGLYLIHKTQYKLYEYTDEQFVEILTEGNELQEIIYRRIQSILNLSSDTPSPSSLILTLDEGIALMQQKAILRITDVNLMYADFFCNLGQDNKVFVLSSQYFGATLYIVGVLNDNADGYSSYYMTVSPYSMLELTTQDGNLNLNGTTYFEDIYKTLSSIRLDTTPIDGSDNLVLSSGVYSALKDKADKADTYSKTEVDNLVNEVPEKIEVTKMGGTNNDVELKYSLEFDGITPVYRIQDPLGTETDVSKELALKEDLSNKANTSDVYTKSETYSKTEVNSIQNNLNKDITQNSDDIYALQDIVEPLQESSSIIDYGVLGTMMLEGVLDAYTKEEIDEKLDGINTNNLVTLDGNQTITGTKTINRINIGSSGGFIDHDGVETITIYDPNNLYMSAHGDSSISMLNTDIYYKSPLHQFEGDATFYDDVTFNGSIVFSESGNPYIQSNSEKYLHINSQNLSLYSPQSISIENDNDGYMVGLYFRDGQYLSAYANTINIQSENDTGDIACLTFQDGELAIHADGSGARFDSTTDTTFEGDATFKGAVDFSNATITKIPMGDASIEYSTYNVKDYLDINSPNLRLYSQTVEIENENDDGDIAGLYFNDAGLEIRAANGVIFKGNTATTFEGDATFSGNVNMTAANSAGNGYVEISGNDISLQSDDSDTGDLSQLNFNGGKLSVYADTEVVYQSPSHKFKGAVDFSEATITNIPMSELGNSYIKYQMSTTTNKEYLYINNPNLRLYSPQSISIENDNDGYMVGLYFRDGQYLSALANTINIQSEDSDTGDVSQLSFSEGKLGIAADNGVTFGVGTTTTFEGDATFKGAVDLSEATISDATINTISTGYIEMNSSGGGIEYDEGINVYDSSNIHLTSSTNTNSSVIDMSPTQITYDSDSHKFKGAVDFTEATVTGLPAESNNTILTSAPTAENTTGIMKFVVLASEPATRYNGYLYIITG